MQLSLDQAFARQAHVLDRPVEGGAILLDMRTGTLFALNRVGARVWALLSDRAKPRVAYQEMVAAYPDVARDVVERDVLVLVEELTRRGLLQVASVES